MEKAAADEKRAKAATLVLGADSQKRPLPGSNDQASDPKRRKLEPESNGASASFLAAFDFTSLPASLITELIVANLEAFTEPALTTLVQLYRQSRGGDLSSPAVPSIASELMSAQISNNAVTSLVKEETVDPLQMDIDEEIEYEPDRLNMEVCSKCYYHSPIILYITLVVGWVVYCRRRAGRLLCW